MRLTTEPLPSVRVRTATYTVDEVLTARDLPRPESIKAWTPKRKKIFVLAVRENLISRKQFVARYGVSEKEFDLWTARYIRHEDEGLTRRALHEMRQQEVAVRGLKQKLDKVVSLPGLRLDPSRLTIAVARKRAVLEKGEYRFMAYLALHPGRVVPKDELLDALYDAKREAKPEIFSVQLFRIRKKLGEEHAALVETVRGRGYRMNVSSAAPVLVVVK